jgi:hypothetical protein
MSERRYYIVEGEAVAKFDALFEKEAAGRKQAKAITKEVGAEKFACTHGFGTHLSAFTFKEGVQVDQKLFRMKDGFWVPRLSSKAGRKLAERMRAVEFMDGEDFAEAVGIKTFLAGRWCTPGVEKIGDTYLLTADAEAGTPKHCRRISDIKAEEMRKPKRKKRKAS